MTMRSVSIIIGVVMLFVTAQANAQGWQEFHSPEDRFVLSFPGEPTLEQTTWIDQHDQTRAARRYTAQRAGNIYSLIAVDYEDADFNLAHGSYDHAAYIYRMKGEVTYDGWAAVDRVEGHQLQITLPDSRRIFFAAHYSVGRLYIMEANVSARAAPPIQFQQSMIFIDEGGARIRYTQTGERITRTDDLPEALGGPDFDAPILNAGSDVFIP
jgi:hypothetical protein